MYHLLYAAHHMEVSRMGYKQYMEGVYLQIRSVGYGRKVLHTLGKAGKGSGRAYESGNKYRRIFCAIGRVYSE